MSFKQQPVDNVGRGMQTLGNAPVGNLCHVWDGYHWEGVDLLC